MEPRTPGPILYSSLNKRESERERVLNQKAVLKNGVYTNVFEVTYHNGLEQWFCRACKCPVMGKVFQHEMGRRHFLNLQSNSSQMEHNQKEELKEEDIPVEPKAIIQDTLDAFQVGALVALEYLVELQDEYDPSIEPLYLCVLCDKRADPRSILAHVSSKSHIIKYLQIHFATCWRLLTPYCVPQYKRNWSNALQKIAEAIEKKFGRLRPFLVGKQQFENDKSRYLLKISNGKHFNETTGYTFEELVVHEELTKTFEDEMQNAQVTSSTCKSTAVIAKPFQKRQPSTAQNKWTKGTTQLENRNKPTEKANYDNKSSVAKKETSASYNNPQRQTNQGNTFSSAGSIPSSRNTRDQTFPDRERKLPYKRHRTPSPARGTRPSRRSPFAGRRSLSPRRHQARNPEADVNKALENEKKQLWKIQEFRTLSRAIEDDMQNTLKVHEKYPEEHPKYNEEWKKFWNRRYKELQAYGVDVSKHDFKPEWIIFWNKRMIEIHSDELRSRKEALRKRLALPEELNAIKLLYNPQIGVANVGPKLPLTALSNQDDDVVVIEDEDDDVVIIEDDDDNKGPNSRTNREISPVRRNSTGSSRSISPVRRSPGRSTIRRSPRRRSPARKSPARRSRSRSRNSSRSRNLSRDRSRNRRSRSGDTLKSRNRRSISRERGDYEGKVHVGESSFERDMRAEERVRTVADLPWERESVYRMPYDHFYEPEMMMPRKPEPILLPPEEDMDVDVATPTELPVTSDQEREIPSSSTPVDKPRNLAGAARKRLSRLLNSGVPYKSALSQVLEQREANFLQEKKQTPSDQAADGVKDLKQRRRPPGVSGAQWRRIMKAEKIAAGTWVDKPRGSRKLRPKGVEEGSKSNKITCDEYKTPESQELPKRPRIPILAFFPGPETDQEETARTLLGRQNPDLKVADWLLLSRASEKKGQVLAYSVDEPSFRTLERDQFRAFYKMNRVTFRVLRGLNGGDSGEGPGPSSEPAS